MNDDTMDSMLEWREHWITEMTQRSQHPAPFWQTVADCLIADGQFLQHDPSSPLGQYVLDSTNPPKPDKPTHKVWSAEEVKKFLAYVREDRLYAFWVLTMTGMRLGVYRPRRSEKNPA